MLGHYPTAGAPTAGVALSTAAIVFLGAGSTGGATSSSGAISVTAFATTVTFSVVDAAGAVMADTSGLDYAFFDQSRISQLLAPVKTGTTLAITSGTATFSIAGSTTLLPGAKGYMRWGDSSGTKSGGGQVTVS